MMLKLNKIQRISMHQIAERVKRSKFVQNLLNLGKQVRILRNILIDVYYDENLINNIHNINQSKTYFKFDLRA